MRDPEFQDNFDPARDKSAAGSGEDRRNLWQVLSRIMELVVYGLIILVVAKLFWPEVERQQTLQAELESKSRVLETKQSEVERLRLEHTLLSTDKEYLETVSRDRLNMQKEGEYIIRIERD